MNYVIEIQQQIAAEYGSVEFKAAVAATVTVDDETCAVPRADARAGKQ
ncbi:MAG: hypothetical protein R3E66_10260 [bacterium]